MRSGESDSEDMNIISAPEPTLAKIALTKFWLKILQEQRVESELLKPFILQSMQVVETPDGHLRRMTNEESLETLTPTHQTSYKNLQLFLSRNKFN